MGIGKKIRDLRKNRGLTQNELAQDLMLAQDTISRIEKDNREVTNNELVIISKYFGVSTDYLLGVTEHSISIDTEDGAFIRKMCEYTGLSEKAVSNLHDIIKKSSEQDLSDDFAIRDLSTQFIDYLLLSNDLFAISAFISECCSLYQLSNESHEALIEFNDLSAFDTAKACENRARVARYEAIEYFTKCINSFIDSDGLKQKNSELLNKSTAQFYKIVEELEKEGVE